MIDREYRLEPDLKAGLDEYAAAIGSTTSGVLRWVLEEYASTPLEGPARPQAGDARVRVTASAETFQAAQEAAEHFGTNLAQVVRNEARRLADLPREK